MLGRFQRFGPWLLSLFLIAQIGGVVPLISVDAVHEYAHTETVTVSAELLETHNKGKPDQNHHQGVHDEHDACCALHHGLIGMIADLPQPVTLQETGVTFESLPAGIISTLVLRIDRPPRPLPLI